MRKEEGIILRYWTLEGFKDWENILKNLPQQLFSLLFCKLKSTRFCRIHFFQKNVIRNHFPLLISFNTFTHKYLNLNGKSSLFRHRCSITSRTAERTNVTGRRASVPGTKGISRRYPTSTLTWNLRATGNHRHRSFLPRETLHQQDFTKNS